MDLVLRCNSLKCRAHLNDRAVVTTCSHIFCEQCSNGLGLSNAGSGVRTCPACETQLANPDDAVLTTLNPTEDYKTSVLSGLNPSIIMECASRGVAFFQYQISQEITYQNFMAKNLTDKYGVLSTQMDGVINDANAEIMTLRDKLSVSQQDKRNLENKNAELAEAFKEKSRAQQRLQTLYQKLKGRVNAVQVEDAAAHDVENVIHAVTTGHRSNDERAGPVPQRPRIAHTSVPNTAGIYTHQRQGSGSSGGRPPYGWEGQGTRGASHSSPSIHTGRPLHRDHLAAPLHPKRDSGHAAQPQSHTRQGNFGLTQPSPARQRLGDIDPNIMSMPGVNGYGMSAGMKVGRQGGGQPSRLSRNTPRNLGHFDTRHAMKRTASDSLGIGLCA